MEVAGLQSNSTYGYMCGLNNVNTAQYTVYHVLPSYIMWSVLLVLLLSVFSAVWWEFKDSYPRLCDVSHFQFTL